MPGVYHDLIQLVNTINAKSRLDPARTDLKKRRFIAFVACSTIIFTVISLSIIGVLQGKNIISFQKNQTQKIESRMALCGKIYFSNFNIISHPIASFLVVFYMFIFWRHRFAVDCLLARPAVPMIIHPFKKRARFMSACVYAIIAYEVMNIVEDTLTHQNHGEQDILDAYADMVPDPTGLFTLFMRLVEMIVAALRYYPPMIAFHANSVVVYWTTAIYMLIDIINNIYDESQCNGFYSYGDRNPTEFLVFGTGKLVVTILQDIPHFTLLWLVTSVLFYKSIELTIVMLSGSRRRAAANNRMSVEERQIEKEKLLVNEDTLFYSKYDIKYCMQIFKNATGDDDYDDNEKRWFARLRSTRVGGRIVRLFERYVYKWHPHFKFSSRIISAHLVAALALYYFFLEWLFDGLFEIKKYSDKAFNMFELLINSLAGLVISDKINLEWGRIIIIPRNLVAAFVAATFSSYFICCVQAFFGLRELKYGLIKMYKGKHSNLPKKSTNTAIIKGNTSLSGFLVGFLLNGFIFIFAFLFFVFTLMFYAAEHSFFTFSTIAYVFLRLLPIIVILSLRALFDYLCYKFVFLQDQGKALALRNYRLYALFTYLVFFYDCFAGIISAFLRLATGVICSIMFMPRIGYSFLGKLDFISFRFIINVYLRPTA